jgi:hypothetical protein
MPPYFIAFATLSICLRNRKGRRDIFFGIGLFREKIERFAAWDEKPLVF